MKDNLLSLTNMFGALVSIVKQLDSVYADNRDNEMLGITIDTLVRAAGQLDDGITLLKDIVGENI